MSPKKVAASLGLDISTNSVKVAEVTVGKGEPALSNLGIVRMPDGVIRDGEVEDGVALAESLKELWAKTGIKGKSVILGIANQRVIVRPIELPYMEKEELDNALRFQVQEFIPIPIEDAILDFDIIEEFMTADEERMLTVLLVAAHKDMIQSFIEVLKSAGLTLAAIDLKAFALARSLIPLGVLQGGYEEGEAICLINVGAGMTNIAILKDNVPRFARFLLRGGDDFVRAIVNRLDIDWEEADALRRGRQANEEADKVLQQEIFNFVGEIRRSIDYYIAQTQERTFSKVVLSGSGSATVNLMQEMNRGLRLPVELGRPLQNVQLGRLPYTAEELAEIEPAVAVSVGLALREVVE
ncbi:MAG: type IV pilus assembly protein PilM [Actinomycetota bacterium]|nr:type IV pilus assembly protein PilM [Actinomycetota bacterium]MDD5666050.1 type IV pilus assembly protein PilM [Actinomycetota bacterium]